MTKCVFCGKEQEAFTGVHMITNSGTVQYYCSGKCRKNALKLGRDRRKLKWTEAYRLAREKAKAGHAKQHAAVKKEEAIVASVNKRES